MRLRNNKHTLTPQKKTRNAIPQEKDTLPRSCVQRPMTVTHSPATKTPKSRTTHEPEDASPNKRRRVTSPRGDAISPPLAKTEDPFWTYSDTPCPTKRKQRKGKPANMRQTTPIIITDESDIEDDGDHAGHDESAEEGEDEEAGDEELQDEVMEEEESEGEAAEDNDDDDGDDEREDDEEDDEEEDDEEEEEDDEDDEVTFVRENVIIPVSTRRQYADKHPPPPPSPPQASTADAGMAAPHTTATVDLCGFVNKLMQKPEVWPHMIDVMRETGILSNLAQQVAASGLTIQQPPSHEENTQTQSQSQPQVAQSAAQQEQPDLVTPTAESFNSLRAISSPLSQAETLRPSPMLSSPGSESTSTDSESTTSTDEPETSAPPTIWSALEQDMMQHPSADPMEWFWRMGTQYGIGAGVAAFRQALNEVPGVAARQSGPMPATEDVSVAARAARDVLWARQQVVDAIVGGGAAQHVRESGGFIRACSLLESRSDADADAGAGADAGAEAGAAGGDVFAMADNEEPVSYTAGGDFVGGVDMSRLDGNAGLAARMLLEHEMDVDEA